jgi:hypothetical protein
MMPFKFTEDIRSLDDIMLLKSNFRHEFTYDSDKFPEEFSSNNFETRYCHTLKCNVKPFYLGTETYYDDEFIFEHNGKNAVPKRFIHKFVLLTDIKKEAIPDKKAIYLFDEYLLIAAMGNWKY